jgi:hypothetical protein
MLSPFRNIFKRVNESQRNCISIEMGKSDENMKKHSKTCNFSF